jgi:PUB domain
MLKGDQGDMCMCGSCCITSALLRNLTVIGQLVYIAACNPNEEKYKSVKTTNAKVNALIVNSPGALEAMQSMGWQHEEEVLRCPKAPTMAQVGSATAWQTGGGVAVPEGAHHAQPETRATAACVFCSTQC